MYIEKINLKEMLEIEIGSLCVFLPLPGRSDDNILPVFTVSLKSTQALELVKERYQTVSSLDKPEVKWQLINVEVSGGNSVYDGIVVAFYDLVAAS
jgi:hypothetical protein